MKADADLYRIGTAARLTGVTVECLRAWERRYGLAPARRAGKTRYYSLDQIEKLKKIKNLIDQGHPIGSLTELSSEQLEARLSRPSALPNRLPQVGLVGAHLVLLEQASGDSDRVEVRHRWVEIEDFIGSRAAERAELDVVVVQLPTLNPAVLERVRRAVPDCRVVAVYQFAAPEAILHAEGRGVRTLVWPVEWETLTRACATPAGTPLQAGKAAPRRYTEHELVAMGSQAIRRGEETTRHLVTLVMQLNAFCDFVTQCIVEQPESAEVHERIREEASYARAQLERALAVVAETHRLTA